MHATTSFTLPQWRFWIFCRLRDVFCLGICKILCNYCSFHNCEGNWDSDATVYSVTHCGERKTILPFGTWRLASSCIHTAQHCFSRPEMLHFCSQWFYHRISSAKLICSNNLKVNTPELYCCDLHHLCGHRLCNHCCKDGLQPLK